MYIPTNFIGAQQKRFKATGGATATFTSGSIVYQSHTFDSGGTFLILEEADFDKILLLVVAGGASGGAGERLGPGPPYFDLGGGGGGAGGARLWNDITAPVGSYPITVGNGGASVSGATQRGNYGDDSSALGKSTSGGGAGGGGYQSIGFPGGSGGGTGGGTAGLVSPGAGVGLEGNQGGYGVCSQTCCAYPGDWTGGGGGGAGSSGQSSSPTAGCGDRVGGSGSYFNIRTGVDELYAEGGHGGFTNQFNPETKGSGGKGGIPNTYTSTAGRSGRVIITYPIRNVRP